MAFPCVSAQLSARLFCCDIPGDTGDTGRGCSPPSASACRIFRADLAGRRPRGPRRWPLAPPAAASASLEGRGAPACCAATAASAAAAAAAAPGEPGGRGGLPGGARDAGTSSNGDGGGRFHEGQAPAAGSAVDELCWACAVCCSAAACVLSAGCAAPSGGCPARLVAGATSAGGGAAADASAFGDATAVAIARSRLLARSAPANGSRDIAVPKGNEPGGGSETTCCCVVRQRLQVCVSQTNHCGDKDDVRLPGSAMLTGPVR